jgi:pyruvate kinase
VHALAEAGADGFRLNTAHLAPADVPHLVDMVRSVERQAGRPLGLMVDLAGPKLRVAKGQGPVALAEGSLATLGGKGSGAVVVVEGVDLSAECELGSRILVHDGKIVLAVRGRGVGVVQAEVVRGGDVAAGMGVNLPDGETSLPSLTERDLACLAAAVTAGVEVFALSFVRRVSDVVALRSRLRAAGSQASIVAKLEKRQAVAPGALEEIVAAADAALVARGDLGAETSPELVPVLQKNILRAARAVGVPTIVATELLESMREGTRPTRAEAADVANAVYDGADALLLTAETAIGSHPALAVATASRIVDEAERHPQFGTPWFVDDDTRGPHDSVADATAAGAVRIAEQLEADAIVCFTASGRTARLVAGHRPLRPILALTPHERVARALAMVWGVRPFTCTEHPLEHEAVVALAEREAAAHGLLAGSGTLVVTHGAPGGVGAPTNLVRVHEVRGAGKT